jgi:hypothetical protein
VKGTDMAESYSISDDELTWTVTIKENANWHDGTPVTAEDVKFTIEACAKGAMVNSVFSGAFGSIEGYNEVKAGEATEVSGLIADGKTIDALGHNFVNGDCSRCDEVLTSRFEDVKPGLFYFDPVEWAVEKGITTGATATTFNPDGQCSRAEVVTFLWRAAGEPEPTTTENPFDDIQEGAFYYKAVLWANEKNITNGLSATTFGPFAKCNRAQVVTFLWRAQNEPASDAEVTFTDVKDGQFYTTAVAWAVEHNITNGISATEFGVSGICNRAQVVTFLYRSQAE